MKHYKVTIHRIDIVDHFLEAENAEMAAAHALDEEELIKDDIEHVFDKRIVIDVKEMIE